MPLERVDHNSNSHVMPAFMQDMEVVEDTTAAFIKMEEDLVRVEKILAEKEEETQHLTGYLECFEDEQPPHIPPDTISGIIYRMGIILIRMRYLQSVEDDNNNTVRQRHVNLVDNLVKDINKLSE